MKKIKTITIILAIILISLIALAGIYMQTQNRMENKVKDYQLSKEIGARRVIELKVVDSTSKDSDGNSKKDQDASILTEENYETVKNTIEKRLKNLKAQDYVISLNKENGTIIVELPENDNTDLYAYYLTAENSVEITEKDTETELINDSMIESAQYSYNTTGTDGKYQVYLEAKLTKEGQAKIEELSKDYEFLADEIDKIEDSQKSDENESTEDKSTEDNSTEETKKITVLKIAGTEYDIQKIEKDKLKIKIGGETSNTTSVNNNISKAAELAMLVDSGKYPVEYEVENNRYVYSDITTNQILYFVLIVGVILLVILFVIILKYKMNGLLSSIAFIGFLAIYSLLIRYTNVIISIDGIGAVLIIIGLYLSLNQKILNEIKNGNNVKQSVYTTYQKMFIKLIPIMIITIVFCLSGWTNLSSFGMIMFWGLILTTIYTLTITKTLLNLKESK